MSEQIERDPLVEVLGAIRGELHGWHTVLHYGDWQMEFATLQNGCALADLGGWSQLELSGADRTKFLHNLCTNEVRRLEPGQARETCFTSAQGRVLAHGWIFVTEDTLLLQTVPGEAEPLAAHLDRYLIREKVTIANRTDEWGTLLVVGPSAAAQLQAIGIAELPPSIPSITLQTATTGSLQVRRYDAFTSDEYYLVGSLDVLRGVSVALQNAGARWIGAQALEAARIQRGTPWQGIDILEKTLPQELARDERVISFVKGCYVGQETVARLDALGHVNKTLCGLLFTGELLPAAGTSLLQGDKEVGQVTSAAWSPAVAAPVALAYLRVGANQPDQTLESALGPATVTKLLQ